MLVYDGCQPVALFLSMRANFWCRAHRRGTQDERQQKSHSNCDGGAPSARRQNGSC